MYSDDVTSTLGSSFDLFGTEAVAKLQVPTKSGRAMALARGHEPSLAGGRPRRRRGEPQKALQHSRGPLGQLLSLLRLRATRRRGAPARRAAAHRQPQAAPPGAPRAPHGRQEGRRSLLAPLKAYWKGSTHAL